MSFNGKIYTVLAIVILIILFPAIIDFSVNENAGNNQQIVTGPVVQSRLNSLQSLPYHDPITINNNTGVSGFNAAGFTGSGVTGDPYIFKDYFINASGDNGINIEDTNALFIIENVHVNGSDGFGHSGVLLMNVTNGLLINCSVTNSTYGFGILYSDNNTLIDNNATGNSDLGFFLGYSDNNTLIDNNATGSDWGFFLGGSHNNTLTGNNATGNVDGFDLHDNCYNNTLRGNHATSNTYGFNLTLSSNYNILTSNTATGNSIEGFYLEDSHNNSLISNNATNNGNNGFRLEYSNYNELAWNNASLNTGLDGFSLNNSIYNILTGNYATGNDFGFYLENSNYNNTYNGNTATGNNNGLVLEHSSWNIFTGNYITDNTGEGFWLDINCNYNTLTGNDASGNNGNGFRLDSSNNNTITGNTANENVHGFHLGSSSQDNNLTGNTANGNQHGFYLQGSSNNNTLTSNYAGTNIYGFFLSSSSNNTLTGNSAYNNVATGPNGEAAFYLSSSNDNTLTGNIANENTRGFYLVLSNNNTLTWNTVYNSTNIGIVLSSSSDNLVYLNFFINNSIKPQGADYSLTNSWNGTTHGNYWSDYTGSDSNGDGIGEDNYTLSGGLQVNDTLPLVPTLLSSLSTLQLTGPGDHIFEVATVGIHTLNWLPVTNIPVSTTYELYLNGSLEDSGNWTSGIPIQVDVNLASLSLGVYNYTLVISDYSNKTMADIVLLTAEDTVYPVITTILDFMVEVGPDAGSLIFTATDLYPDTYTLYLDDVFNKSDTWTSGTVVTIPLINFPLGVYNFTLVVLDTSGNDDTLTVIVTVIDMTSPVITYTGKDTITFEEDSTGNVITVSATDLFPGNYTLLRDGIPVISGNWTNGTTITVSLDYLPLPAGVYNFVLVVRDTTGNEAILSVTVTVTAKSTTTTPTTPTTTPTSSSSMTTTTIGFPSPGWTVPFVLLSLACIAYILSWRRSRRID
ncbi:MAG: right-handed parallel beta-helix repeat-containing protein [Candidatus Hodarchaeales archaeon]|jgi:parallel beta-helix repeat protein